MAAYIVRRLIWVIFLLFVVTLFIYPFFYGIGLSFQPEQGGPFAAYRSFFSDAYERGTLTTSVRPGFCRRSSAIIVHSVAKPPRRLKTGLPRS